ncbi:kielin/chordin-like protein isoform X2 [Amphiura filiformis]|uniref:kielin/chordin-like protein isoform X2 n=1 Tax=Amphiura filiformis TaxID=82378 RepID=UPI003B215CAB
MGKAKCVGKVVIYNRKDCCKERLKGARIHVGSDKNRNNPVCGIIKAKDIKNKSVLEVSCNLKGRYLSVSLPGKDYLTLCEVKAFAGDCDGDETKPPKEPKAQGPPCICDAWGDPHFTSCDGKKFNYQGKCVYVTAKSCGDQKPKWLVEQKNVPYEKNPRHAATTEEIYISLYNDKTGKKLKISLLQRGEVRIGKQKVRLPTERKNVYKIFKSGKNVLVETPFGLKCKWDGKYRWELQIPSKYKNQVCGLCGNFDGNRNNDFMLRNGKVPRTPGQETRDMNQFGNDWTAHGYGCEGEPKEPEVDVGNPCDPPGFEDFAAEKCSIINDKKGPFAQCFKVKNLDPDDFFEACKEELCLTKANDEEGSKDMGRIRCKALEAFADDCKERFHAQESKAVNLGVWKKKLCPMKCPKGSHYSSVMPGCPETCTGGSRNL